MPRVAWVGLLPILFTASIDAQSSNFASPPDLRFAEQVPPVEQTSAIERRLSEEDFLAVLDEAHPAWIREAQALTRARAAVKTAKAFENPTLEVVREDPDGPSSVTDWTISWALPSRGRNLRIAAREQETEAAIARFAQDRRVIRQAMRRAYARWALADQRRQQLARRLERLDGWAAREQARAERGETSGLAASRLGLARADLQAKLATLDVEFEAAWLAAKAWFPDLPPDVRPILPPLEPLPASASTGSTPAERAALSDIRTAELARQAAARFLASPDITIGWQREAIGPENLDGTILGVSWSLPVFNRQQGAIERADAELIEARARLELLTRRVDAERQSARQAYQHLTHAVEATADALDGQIRLLEGAAAAFRYGELTLTDLLETFRASADAEDTRLDLYAAALEARRTLDALEAESAATPQEPTP